MPGVVVRGLLSTLLALVAAVLAAPAALAHDDLVASTPAAGSTVTTVPREVSLTFSGAIGEKFAQVAVIDADGTAYQVGPPIVQGDTVTQAVDGLPTSGALALNFRVVSSDGHPISGSVPFTVDAAAAEPSPTAEATDAARPTASAPATPDPVAASPEPVSETMDATPLAVQPTAAEGPGSAAPLWLLGGAAVLALGGLGVWLTRRHSSSPSGETTPS
jgi:methionine-rich copper-binding protein CopC